MYMCIARCTALKPHADLWRSITIVTYVATTTLNSQEL